MMRLATNGYEVDPVAVYAAIVATGSIVASLFTWHRSRQTRLELDIAPYTNSFGEFKAVRLRVVNKSEHPVRFVSVGLEGKEVGQSIVAQNGVIQPRDAFDHLLYEDKLEAFGFFEDEDIRLWVLLPTGDSEKSKWSKPRG